MCFFNRPSMPAPVAPPSPVVTEQDPAVQAAIDSERRRRAAAMGRQSTILTSPTGVSAPPTLAGKTLLGG